ncbi:hypothetical protein V2J94_41680 [Streptomyces sp. DSM 41524]|uniref:Anti-sigma factor NepR domain-containing protein n=1 Tax=Streptomyces asiaticus subsp. ignotus TaxID=3098222 RepID=A0ABU7QBD8_9ACTN|nr:hypothetical protein [Streptomyces sp. DSM 41524]
MTPAERRALLGDDVIDHIHREVEEALAEAPPTPEVLAALRRILTRPAGRLPVAKADQAA